MRFRAFVLSTVSIIFAAGVAAAKPASLEALTLSASPDEKEIRAYVGAIEKELFSEMDRMRAVAKSRGRAHMNTGLRQALVAKLHAVPVGHTDALCRSATGGHVMVRSLLVEALTTRTDYGDEQKPVLLQYLPKLPELIVVIENNDWFAGAEAAIAAGWKEAKKDRKGDILRTRGLRYATITARHGFKDGLIAIAQIVASPRISEAADRRALEESIPVLEKLVPTGHKTPAELAQFVLKNQKALVFDPQKAVYTLPRES